MMKGERTVPKARPTAKCFDDGDKKPPAAKRPARRKPLPNAKESEPHRVYLWRLEQLERAGMPRHLAKAVAATTIDLHRALTILEAGRSPQSVMELLEPLP